MVYKRYIKRNGKICGPYYYKSYRDKNGKVVSKYLKDYKPKINVKKELIVIFILVGIFIFVIFGVILLRPDSSFHFLNNIFSKMETLTGNVILGINNYSDNDYIVGDKINGTISLEIGENEILDNGSILNLSLIKDGVLLSNTQIPVEDFLNNSNQSGIYSRNISDFLEYKFNSAGNYDFVFELPLLNLREERAITVGEGERMIGIESTPGNISSCQPINVSGNYIMNASIDVATTIYCMNISVSDVILDCNGFYIRKISLGSPGIYAKNVNNITIKNCNSTMSRTAGYGIYFINVSNSLIDNFTTLGNAYGIYLNSSNNITISNSNINGSRLYGICLNYTTNSNINNVNTTYTNDTEIKLYYSDNNNISNFNSSGNSDGASNGFGIFLDNSNNNSISNFYANNNYINGFLINSSSYNSFNNCYGGGNGLDLYLESDNSTYFFNNYFGNYSLNQTGNFIIENNYGKIMFNDYINGSGGNFSDDLKIVNNSAYVNSSQTGLNVSANVSLYNMPSTTGYLNQKILRDGVECNSTTSPACYNFTALTTSNVSFNVSGWSNYSVYRGDDIISPVVTLSSPISGASYSGSSYDVVFIFNASDSGAGIANCTAYANGVAYANTSAINASNNSITASLSAGSYSAYVNCTDYSGNTGNSSNISFTITAPSGDSGNTGGGSSGGGNAAKNNSQQNSSSQTNYSNPSNDFSTEIPMKNESTVKKGIYKFGKSCAPDWICGNWSRCNFAYNLNNIIGNNIVLYGEKSRVCVDNTDCMYDLVERQNCDDRIPIILKKGTGCFEGYMEVYDINNTLISVLSLKNSGVNSLDIRFILDNTHYCPSCYNRIKDSDETGIDCGGLCGECLKFKPNTLPLILRIPWQYLLIAIIIIVILITIAIVLFFNFIRYLKIVRKLKLKWSE